MKALILTERAIITDEWQVIPFAKVVFTYLRRCEHLPESTRRAKDSDLRFFLAYLGRDRSLLRLSLSDYTPETVIGFIEHRLGFESANTVLRRYATLRALDKWIGNHIPTFRKPSHQVRPPKVELGAFKGISREDADALITAAYKLGETPSKKLRNGLAVHLLLATGLRASEVLSFTAGQISRCGRWIRKLKCKGSRFRDVYLPEELDSPMCRWFDVRSGILEQKRITDTAPYPFLISAFRARKNDPATWRMDNKTLWRIVTDAARLADLPHVHPHQLRHTFAHGLMNSTKDVRFVCQALGHADIKTTMRYTERPEDEFAKMVENSRK